MELYFRATQVHALCYSSAIVVLWLFSWVNLFWNNTTDLEEFTVTPWFKGRV